MSEPPRPALRVVLVCTLVVLAGCAGLPGANVLSGSGDGGNATATPAATSAAGQAGVASAEDLQASDFPPGVARDGFTNLSKLVQTNRRALLESGYVSAVRLRGRMTANNRTRNLSLAQREVVAPGAARFLFQVKRQSGPAVQRTDVWSNGSATYARVSRGGQAAYREVPASKVRKQLAGGQLIELYVGPGNFTLRNVSTRDNRTLLTYRSTDYVRRPSGQMPAPENVSAYQAVVVVDLQGRVHFVDVQIAYSGPRGGKARFRLQYAVRSVGGVSVERPSWVETARDRLANSSTGTDDGHGHDHG